MLGHMSSGRVVLVTGRQRTGTSVFRQLLATVPDVVDVGEIFHRGARNLEFNFYRFSGVQTNGRFDALDRTRLLCIWREYLRSTFARTRAATLVIDTKAEYFPDIRDPDATGVWPIFPVTFRPDNNLFVMRLRRRNALAQLVSLKLANETDVWGVVSPNTRRTRIDWMNRIYAKVNLYKPATYKKISLDEATIVEDIATTIAVDQELDGYLSSGVNASIFFYEEMFDNNGRFSNDTIDQCSRILGCSPTDFDARPTHEKIAPRQFSACVENWQVIREVVASSPYAWMLDGYDGATESGADAR